MIQTYKKRLICQLLLLLGIQFAQGQGNTQNFSIGYKSLRYTDYTRSHGSVRKDLGREDSLVSFRTITTSMWYPALDGTDSENMSYAGFFPAMEMESIPDENFAYYFGLDEAELNRISHIGTTSFAAPDFPDKKFPLVIYIPGLNGFSFENHMLCESIARQGYVVISFNSKGTERRWMEPNTGDFENLIRDILFLIGDSKENPMINDEKVTLIGYSVGGHINILTKMRDLRVGGLVSLDGSIKHDYKRTSEFIFNDYSKVNCPVLSVSDQEFEDARTYLDSMYNADRYFYRASGFTHKDYKSITYVLNSECDSAKFDQFMQINDLIVSFVNMIHNKDLNNSFVRLNSELANSQFLTFNKQESFPDIDDLKVLIGKSNFANAIPIYNQLQLQYPLFSVPEEELVHWANRLNYSGFTNHAIDIYKLVIEINPDNQSVRNKLKRLHSRR